MIFDPSEPPANEWPAWPEDGYERLRYWQRRRAAEEERERVVRIVIKRGMGLPLTEREETVLAYSVYGSGQHCGCG